jgi:SPP1 family predicted phage head-tail adaptor
LHWITNRKNNKISQQYSDGVVTIYSVEDTAEPGYKPVEKPTPKIKLFYEEQRLGIQRYYAALQNQVEVTRVVRTPRAGDINNQDIAITEDGKKYAITMVQAVPDVNPPSVDITLSLIE